MAKCKDCKEFKPDKDKGSIKHPTSGGFCAYHDRTDGNSGACGFFAAKEPATSTWVRGLVYRDFPWQKRSGV